ncbi:LytR/AlgR family response regulator transcription factor [Confluentibacter sediminis]|uniref:LytR/AlgR family response regulator transcription factor n=1 Tax=Confluentibacter sediminis TaxID=2219045 RepID=UPI000DABBFC8|nr:LytTR family DNA-binding domain-containing protein [Confluentibacter sediminis]
MTIAIIDDEQHCIDRIVKLLEPYKDKMKVVTYSSVETAIVGINTVKPEIVFLDVQIHNKTAFDILKAVDFNNFSLVFTTAYERYAIEAFKFSALDYLLKPITEEDFENTIQRIFKKAEQTHLTEQVNMLLANFSNDSTSKKISIPTHDGYLFLSISDIIRCQSNVNYTHIFAVDQKKYTVSKTLKYFEELLTNYGFFRIHNSHLINMSYIKAYSKNGYVTLSDNCKLEVSVRRKDAFLKACHWILK